MKLEALLQKTFNTLFTVIMKTDDNEMYDIVIEYKSKYGKTIRYSWRDREQRLEDTNH